MRTLQDVHHAGSWMIFLFFLALFIMPLSASAAAPNAGTIRSATIYLQHSALGDQNAGLYDYLVEHIPELKANGFNTFWFVTPWATFDKRPLTEPRVYTDGAFASAKNILELLRQNDMRALIGLNYFGAGWGPDYNNDGVSDEKDKNCELTTDPQKFAAFDAYVEKFLTEMQPYSDIIYPVVFTEASTPCGLTVTSDGVEVAAIMRNTLGSVPNRLPPSLREKYNFGYHDNAILTSGTGFGVSPAMPNTFDFFSTVAYDFDDLTDSEIIAEIDLRADRFRQAHPCVPLIIGELGARSCSGTASDPTRFSEATQSRAISTTVRHALSRGIGINLWTYPWIPADSSVNCPDGELVLERKDGTPKAVIPALQDIFSSIGPCYWNGQSVAPGASVVAYQRPRAPFGGQCVSQTRTCSSDVLTGSYFYSSCTVDAPLPPPLLTSSTEGTSPFPVVFTYNLNRNYFCDAGSYRFSFGDEDWAAGDVFKNLIWAAGICGPVTGTISHTYTIPGAYKAALNNGSTGEAISSAIMYVAPKVSDTPPLKASIAGGTVPFTVAFSYTLNKDSSCSAGYYSLSFGDEDWAAGDVQQKVSWNAGACAPITGTITHTYTTPGIYLAQLNNPGIAQLGSAKITVASPTVHPSCSWNGQSVAHGSAVTAYQSANVAYGEQCTSQTRTCADGALSGSYPYAACAVNLPVPLIANITAGTAPLPVAFTYRLNVASSCSAGYYSLSFGDEDWAAGDVQQKMSWNAGVCAPIVQTMTHTYTKTGIYLAQLNNPGIVQLGSAKISVAAAPPPPEVVLPGTTAEDIVVADVNEGTAPFPVTFSYLLNRTASCSAGAYTLYFGDENWAAGDTAKHSSWGAGGCAQSIQTITHTYTQKGIYKMQIFDQSSGAGVFAGSELVTVLAAPVASASFDYLGAYSSAFNSHLAVVAVGMIDAPLSILTDALGDLFYNAGIY